MTRVRVFLYFLLGSHVMAMTAYCAIFNSAEVVHFASARDGVFPNEQTDTAELELIRSSGPFDVFVGKQEAAAIGGANAFFDVQAAARSGAIRVKAVGLASVSANRPNTARFSGHSQAFWKDDIRLTIPGDPFVGHIAVNAVLNLHGTFDVDPGPGGDGFIQLFIFESDQHAPSLPDPPNPICDCWGQIRKNFDGSSNVEIVPPTQIPVRIDIFFPGGTVGEYPLGYQFQVTADGGAGGGAPGAPGGITVVTADFSNTLSWGGITSVEKLSTGEPITDYTISSSSGFDYRRSFEAQIPEPSSLVLLTMGLFAMLARLRRADRIMSKGFVSPHYSPAVSEGARPSA